MVEVKSGLSAVVVISLLVGGASLAARLAPVPVRDGVIMINLFQADRKDQPALFLGPSGNRLAKVSSGEAVFLLGKNRDRVCLQFEGRMSPDGRLLAGIQFQPVPKEQIDEPGPWVLANIWVFDLESKDGPQTPVIESVKQPSRILENKRGEIESVAPDLRHLSVVWSSDGRKLYLSEIDPSQFADRIDAAKPIPYVSWEYDLIAKTKTKLALPAGHAIVDASRDGKWLLTQLRMPYALASSQGFVVPLDTLTPRPLGAEPFQAPRISPDGKELIAIAPRKKGEGQSGTGLVVVSVADGSRRFLPLPKNAASIQRACWAPDGRKIAYEWIEELSPLPAATGPDGRPLIRPPGVSPFDVATRVSVADRDGRNEKTILRCEQNQTIQGLDWK